MSHIAWFHLYEILRRGKSTETESKLVVTCGLRGGMVSGNGEWIKDMGFGLRGVKNVLKLDSDCLALWIYLEILYLCPLQIVIMVHFMSCVFHHKKGRKIIYRVIDSGYSSSFESNMYLLNIINLTAFSEESFCNRIKWCPLEWITNNH